MTYFNLFRSSSGGVYFKSRKVVHVKLNCLCCDVCCLLSLLNVSKVMFPFLDFLTVLMEVHCLFLLYRWNPLWQNFFPLLLYLLLLWFQFSAYILFQLRVVLSHTQQPAHLDTRSLFTRYVSCQQHTQGNFTSSTNEFGSASEAIWKTLWKDTFLSGTRLLAAQHIANHFND
jgi:hypothetical protein